MVKFVDMRDREQLKKNEVLWYKPSTSQVVCPTACACGHSQRNTSTHLDRKQPVGYHGYSDPQSTPQIGTRWRIRSSILFPTVHLKNINILKITIVYFREKI